LLAADAIAAANGSNKAGASEEVLRQIMNDNPRRFLAFVPKVKRRA